MKNLDLSKSFKYANSFLPQVYILNIYIFSLSHCHHLGPDPNRCPMSPTNNLIGYPVSGLTSLLAFFHNFSKGTNVSLLRFLKSPMSLKFCGSLQHVGHHTAPLATICPIPYLHHSPQIIGSKLPSQCSDSHLAQSLYPCKPSAIRYLYHEFQLKHCLWALPSLTFKQNSALVLSLRHCGTHIDFLSSTCAPILWLFVYFYILRGLAYRGAKGIFNG